MYDKKYIDDVNLVADAILRGCFWERTEQGLTLSCSQQELETDNLNDREIQDSKCTMDLIAEVSNTIMPSLSFTVYSPSLHSNRHIPMLDLMVWMDQETDENRVSTSRI